MRLKFSELVINFVMSHFVELIEFSSGAGILHLYQHELITLDFIQGAQFLTRLPEDLSSEKLFRSIEAIRMPRYAEVLAAARASPSSSDYAQG